MNQLEIQAKMSLLFEELKSIEVKTQKNEEELTQALAKENTCKEGLSQVIEELKAYKKGDLVDITKFAHLKKVVDSVEKFHDQSKALRLTLECEKVSLTLAQEATKFHYDRLGSKLSDNVLLFTIK
jgi:hypothetical protein